MHVQTIKTSEYYLGRSGSLQEASRVDDRVNEDEEGDKEGEETERSTQDIPTWHYDGMEYPYFQVEMKAGTPCDIRNNEPRSTRLLFICLEDVVAEVRPSS